MKSLKSLAIQNDRDRIGYTKRKRKHDDNEPESSNHHHHTEHVRDGSSGSPQMNDDSPENCDMKDIKIDLVGFFYNHSIYEFLQLQNCLDPIAERLTTLENNFTLLLSRCADLHSYATLEDALNAPSRFMQPIACEVSLLTFSSSETKCDFSGLIMLF